MSILRGESKDILQENIEHIKQLFPEVCCEDKIDFDKLKQVLGEYVDDDKERYNFTWNGKGRSLRLSQTPSLGTLRPCKEESKDWDSTQNLYIEGDNLEVLKLLQKSYYGKVKMIYIDPPYNTGNDFVYPDNFDDSIEHYKEITGQIDSEGKKRSTNPETNGRFHTDWLNMMYPRLKLARNLLSDEGVIFISIDENEVNSLKNICNEIFGENNFIAELIWSAGRKNDSKYISVSHEYILCYFKNMQYIRENNIIWREKKQGLTEIYEEYNRLIGQYGNDYGTIEKSLKDWFRMLPDSHPAKEHSHYNRVDENGIYFADNISWPGGGGPKYPVMHPITQKPVKIPSRGWITNEEKMNEWIKEGRVQFGKDENAVPTLKAYLKDREWSVPYSVIYKDGRASSKRLANLMGDKVFENPKDEEVIQKIIEFASACDDDIILDFFSGSATTAHAVFSANTNQNTNRKFILVQLPESIDMHRAKAEKNKKVAENAISLLDSINKPHNICEIGKERIRRAGGKIKAQIEEENAQMKLGEEPKKIPDIGFRVFKLDSSNLKKWQPDYDDLEKTLLDSIENYVEGRSKLDVVYEIILKMGLDLTYPVDELDVNGRKIYSVAFGALMICLDDHITKEIADGMISLYQEYQPELWKVVFKDNGFENDSAKTNIKEQLKVAGLEEDAFTTI